MLENMAQDASGMRPESARSRQRKKRLRTLDRLDGRTRAAKRARHLMRVWTAALGGAPSEAQVQAIRYAAACAALAEDAQARRLAGDTSLSVEQLTRLANAAARAVARLDLPRREFERERQLDPMAKALGARG